MKVIVPKFELVVVVVVVVCGVWCVVCGVCGVWCVVCCLLYTSDAADE